MRCLRRFARSSSGGAAVELAVVFPVLLLLIIAIVDYGRVFYTSVVVSNAARAGAEYGAQGIAFAVDTAGQRDYAQTDGNEAGALTIASRFYCECSGAANNTCGFCGGAAPDVFVEVTATKAVNMMLPYPGFPSTITIVRKATFPRTQ